MNWLYISINAKALLLAYKTAPPNKVLLTIQHKPGNFWQKIWLETKYKFAILNDNPFLRLNFRQSLY